MMRLAGPAKLVALSVALGLHGALAVALVSRDTTEIEGADGGTEVRLGSAFADMAAGTLSSQSAEKAEATAPDAPDRLHAEHAEPSPPERAATTVDHAPTGTARPLQAEPVPSEQALSAVNSAPSEPAAPAQAVPVARADPSPAVQAVVPGPDAAETLQSPPVADRVEGAAPDSAAVVRSLRPKPRSAAFEATQKPAPVAKPEPRPTAKPATRAAQAPGNAERNARAGEATGRQEAVAQQSGTAGRQHAAGNAAASNYPGLVMRRLSRAGKPRVTARGTAVVVFSIAANGGLSSVSLARSSGSAALDRAALQLVRGAGPFPQPPAGARRSFSIQITGR
ncbi:TonB family protein [Pseudooceanicola sp. 216_PA32_1]|uniref:TonB family protein n=1 Tax=Pseudooceanicola pacificus TaxID=2676438 RepID=A0A844W875_9RHOB|nr:TonB family protein [Pseudooceanicola pacificus]MWB79081.1 TonB family protein [Pseudooceanicola pacificus]